LVGANQVAWGHLEGMQAEAVGDGVHQPLAHEGALMPSRGPIGAGWRLVREPKSPHDAVRGNLVRAWEERGSETGHCARVGAYVRPLIQPELDVYGEDQAGGLDSSANAMDLV